MIHIPPRRISREVNRMLRLYTDEVINQVEEAKDEVSKECLQHIKADSPKKTGKYATGWTRKKTKDGFVIYNKTSYQLTHLLEERHLKRGGGFKEGIPHIRINEVKAIEKFLQKVEEAIQQ